MNYQNIGLILLVPSTLIGIYVLGMNNYLMNNVWLPIPLLHFSIINGTVWVIGISFTIKGLIKNNDKRLQEKKRKAQNRMNYEENETKKKLNQDKEIKELKEKVEALEKDK